MIQHLLQRFQLIKSRDRSQSQRIQRRKLLSLGPFEQLTDELQCRQQPLPQLFDLFRRKIACASSLVEKHRSI